MSLAPFFAEFRSALSEKPGYLTTRLVDLIQQLVTSDIPWEQIEQDMVPFLADQARRQPLVFGPKMKLLSCEGLHNDDALLLRADTPTANLTFFFKRKFLLAMVGAPVRLETRMPPGHVGSKFLHTDKVRNISLLIHKWSDAQRFLDKLPDDLQGLNLVTSPLGLRSVEGCDSLTDGRELDLSRFKQLKVLTMPSGICAPIALCSGSFEWDPNEVLPDRDVITGFTPAIFNKMKLPPSLEILCLPTDRSPVINSGLAQAVRLNIEDRWIELWTSALGGDQVRSMMSRPLQIKREFSRWRESLRSQPLPNLKLLIGDPSNFVAPNLAAVYVGSAQGLMCSDYFARMDEENAELGYQPQIDTRGRLSFVEEAGGKPDDPIINLPFDFDWSIVSCGYDSWRGRKGIELSQWHKEKNHLWKASC